MRVEVPEGATIVEVQARRSAGPAASGALGVSLGAAGEFVRRQKALQAERAAAADEPRMDVPGTGVVIRRG